MFDSKNYGCAVIVMCDVNIRRIVSTYAGFTVVRVDDNSEIARFYEGDPQEDCSAAIAYAQSISSKITNSPTIKDFFEKLGKFPEWMKKHA